MRLQLGKAHHPAFVGDNESRQEFAQAHMLRAHGFAAGGELEAGAGELPDVPREVRAGAGRVKRLQRGSMHNQGDGDMIRPADAVEMVLDVAHHKADLVEVAEMIDYLQLRCSRRFGGRACGCDGEQAGKN